MAGLIAKLFSSRQAVPWPGSLDEAYVYLSSDNDDIILLGMEYLDNIMDENVNSGGLPSARSFGLVCEKGLRSDKIRVRVLSYTFFEKVYKVRPVCIREIRNSIAKDMVSSEEAQVVSAALSLLNRFSTPDLVQFVCSMQGSECLRKGIVTRDPDARGAVLHGVGTVLPRVWNYIDSSSGGLDGLFCRSLSTDAQEQCDWTADEIPRIKDHFEDLCKEVYACSAGGLVGEATGSDPSTGNKVTLRESRQSFEGACSALLQVLLHQNLRRYGVSAAAKIDALLGGVTQHAVERPSSVSAHHGVHLSLVHHATASRFDRFLQVFLHISIAYFPGLVSRTVPAPAKSEGQGGRGGDGTVCGRTQFPAADYLCYRFLSQLLICIVHEAGVTAPVAVLVAVVKERYRFGDEAEEEGGDSVLGPHKSNTRPSLTSLVSMWAPHLVEMLEREDLSLGDEALSALATDLLELLRSPCAGNRHARATLAQRACLSLLQRLEAYKKSSTRAFVVMLGLLEAALALRHASVEATAKPQHECERALQLVCSLERPNVAVARLAAEMYRILFIHAPEVASSSSFKVDDASDSALIAGLRVGAALVASDRSPSGALPLGDKCTALMVLLERTLTKSSVALAWVGAARILCCKLPKMSANAGKSATVERVLGLLAKAVLRIRHCEVSGSAASSALLSLVSSEGAIIASSYQYHYPAVDTLVAEVPAWVAEELAGGGEHRSRKAGGVVHGQSQRIPIFGSNPRGQKEIRLVPSKRQLAATVAAFHWTVRLGSKAANAGDPESAKQLLEVALSTQDALKACMKKRDLHPLLAEACGRALRGMGAALGADFLEGTQLGAGVGETEEGEGVHDFSLSCRGALSDDRGMAARVPPVVVPLPSPPRLQAQVELAEPTEGAVPLASAMDATLWAQAADEPAIRSSVQSNSQLSFIELLALSDDVAGFISTSSKDEAVDEALSRELDCVPEMVTDLHFRQLSGGADLLTVLACCRYCHETAYAMIHIRVINSSGFKIPAFRIELSQAVEEEASELLSTMSWTKEEVGLAPSRGGPSDKAHREGGTPDSFSIKSGNGKGASIVDSQSPVFEYMQNGGRADHLFRLPVRGARCTAAVVHLTFLDLLEEANGTAPSLFDSGALKASYGSTTTIPYGMAVLPTCALLEPYHCGLFTLLTGPGRRDRASLWASPQDTARRQLASQALAQDISPGVPLSVFTALWSSLAAYSTFPSVLPVRTPLLAYGETVALSPDIGRDTASLGVSQLVDQASRLVAAGVGGAALPGANYISSAARVAYPHAASGVSAPTEHGALAHERLGWALQSPWGDVVAVVVRVWTLSHKDSRGYQEGICRVFAEAEVRANNPAVLASLSASADELDALLAALSGDVLSLDRDVGEKELSVSGELHNAKLGGWPETASFEAETDGI